MPARLKNLEVTKVDFVDAGDNKGAHVVLFKRAENAKKEGATADMDTVKIDKNKLTKEEAAAWDALVQKAGVPDDVGGSPAAPPAAPVGGETAPAPMGGQEPASTQKSAPDAPVTKTEPVSAASAAVPGVDSGEDVYKGLHPAVAAELDALKKWKDAAEERELRAVAKKYELLGKKQEELVPLLKSLKTAGGGQYEQMIAVLDASLQAVEKSGMFGEIGKTGAAGTVGGTDAWSQIQKHAQNMMTADPSLNIHVAIDKACQAHPELVGEYEASR